MEIKEEIKKLEKEIEEKRTELKKLENENIFKIGFDFEALNKNTMKLNNENHETILKEFNLTNEKVEKLLLDYNADVNYFYKTNKERIAHLLELKKEIINSKKLDEDIEEEKENTRKFMRCILNDSLKNFREDKIKGNKMKVELNMDKVKNKLDSLVKKYGVEYNLCSNTVFKEPSWQENKNDLGNCSAICYYRGSIIVFKNEYEWTLLDFVKEDYHKQMSKYKKRKQMGLGVRCLDINDTISDAMEVTATHEYFHVLDGGSGFKISTDERIIKIHNEQKEKILDELGHYAYYGQNAIEDITEYATRELCAEAFMYINFNEEDRPELANEIIKIIEEICFNKTKKIVGTRN